MPKWNEQQLRAIKTRHQNILVSASAGSGKTTVLVARLMDLVLGDRVGVDQILAMTFTEAAANEMKKRLSASLLQALEECEEEAQRAYLNRQLTLLEQAQISTIHSFCLSVLQSYYYRIGCTARQIANIADDARMEAFRRQAMAETLEKHQGAKLQQLAALFSARVEEQSQMEQAIRSLAVLASSKPDPDRWLDECLKPYQSYDAVSKLPSVIRDSFFAYLDRLYEQMTQDTERLLAHLQDAYPQKQSAIDKAALKQKLMLETKAFLRERDYAGFLRAFAISAAAALPNAPDKDDLLFKRLRSSIQNSEDALAAVLYEEKQLLQDLEKGAPYVQTLVACTRTYRAAYRRLKQEAEVIDFDDMEHFALAILQDNDQEVAKLYQKRFAVIMVDEFQDTNDIQDTIIHLISRSDNVFRVGDVKQSIYGFRHARPQIMRERMEHVGEHDTVIYLSNNYRSSKTLVDFNNAFYQKLMNLEAFAGAYRQEDCVSIGIPQQEAVKEPVHFCAIHMEDCQKQDPMLTAMDRQAIKAHYIAASIRDMHEKRGLKWKDFVVLVRSNKRKDDLRAAFDRLQLPYFIEIKHGFYQSGAVQLVLAVLSFFQDPRDDIAFTALAFSPLLDLSADAMAKAGIARGKASYYSYFQAHPVSGWAEIEALLAAADQPIHRLLNQIYALHDYYDTQTNLQEKTNLDLLYQKAVDFERQQASDLHAFLSYIDAVKDAQTGEANPISSDEDVVRVMSIHQSKGLQFPIVFLWSTDRQTALDFREPFLFDADMGIGLRYMETQHRIQRPTIARIAMQHKKDQEELEEEMRILYVATTRAQNEMYIVDCVRDMEWYRFPLSSATVFSRCGYTGWLLQAFQDTASLLFTVDPIREPFDLTPLAQSASPVVALPRYCRTSHRVERISASKHKAKAGLPDFQPKEALDAAAYGTLLHDLAAKLQPPFTREQVERLLRQEQQPVQPHVVRALLKLGENEQYRQFCAYPHVYHELPYQVQQDEQIYYGYIDFLAMNETEIIVLDYKSDHLTREEEFRLAYQAQLDTYAAAMRILYPTHTIHSFIYSFHLDRMIAL